MSHTRGTKQLGRVGVEENAVANHVLSVPSVRILYVRGADLRWTLYIISGKNSRRYVDHVKPSAVTAPPTNSSSTWDWKHMICSKTFFCTLPKIEFSHGPRLIQYIPPAGVTVRANGKPPVHKRFRNWLRGSGSHPYHLQPAMLQLALPLALIHILTCPPLSDLPAHTRTVTHIPLPVSLFSWSVCNQTTRSTCMFCKLMRFKEYCSLHHLAWRHVPTRRTAAS